MEAYKKWYREHDQSLADGLNKDKRGFELGLKLGWRAALERALKAGQDAGLENFIPVSWVNKELEK